ncbi:DUF4349 domain-containing protein [bacterium]|nr:DUF4349 domain-containing protein [bacterium]
MKKLLSFFAFLLLFSACASSPSSKSFQPSAYSYSQSDSESVSVRTASTGGSTNSVKTEQKDRMVIITTYLTLESDNPEATTEKLLEIPPKYKGYITNSTSKSASIRVPADKLPAALEEIKKLGEVTNQSVYGEDVTTRYLDTQIALDNANKARERYLALLEKAENVQAALLVEKELERLNKEINHLKGQSNYLQHLTQFSTLHITIEKSVTPGPLGWIFYGLYKGVVWLFVWE